MGLLSLKITKDDIDKKSEYFQNLMSFMYGFVIVFSVTLASGFWYFFVPRDINWNASQTILILHIVGGAISLLLFLVFFFLHQKVKEQKWWHLLTPLKLRREPDETPQRFHQRRLGHVLTWTLLTIYVTGVVMALPGLLFGFEILWMQGYYARQILGDVHFWVSILLIPLIFTHMLWLTRKGG